MKIKLRYVLLALILIAAALSFQLGYLKRDPVPAKTEVQRCAEMVIQDMKASAQIRRSLRAAQDETAGDDFLSDICASDPKKCGR